MQKVLRLSRTVSKFKPTQLGEKFNYQLKKFCFEFKLLGTYKKPIPVSEPLDILKAFYHGAMLNGKKFTLLNRSKEFKDEINWNFKGFGLLWYVELNSFEYLNAEKIVPEEGLKVLQSFINNAKENKSLYDSHCISQRIINTIKFCSRFNITEPGIDQFIYSQCIYLRKNPEFHLRNNHLLDNGFALLFGALYFSDRQLYSFSEKLLSTNIPKQILSDGAHFELSPMYHMLMLHRMLDSLYLLNRSDFPSERLRQILKVYIPKMLGWIRQMQMDNGSLPAFNDSAEGHGCNLRTLLRLAGELQIDTAKIALKESGFRKLKNRTFEMIADVNGLAPTVSPGHSHADTFHFILNVFGDPFIIDTGVSTYSKGKERNYERSTQAHNTVVIEDENQSEIYNSFRVGRRASVISLEEGENELTGTHNGYAHQGAMHTRKITLKSDHIEIIDKIISKKPLNCKAFLHIDKKSGLVNKNNLLISRFTAIEFSNQTSVVITDGWHASGFGVKLPCYVVGTTFQNELITRIKLIKH
jgi:hypothetical protein